MLIFFWSPPLTRRNSLMYKHLTTPKCPVNVCRRLPKGANPNKLKYPYNYVNIPKLWLLVCTHMKLLHALCHLDKIERNISASQTASIPAMYRYMQHLTRVTPYDDCTIWWSWSYYICWASQAILEEMNLMKWITQCLWYLNR